MDATCIIVDGPFAAQGRHGDEAAHYTVCLADDNGSEVGKPEGYGSYAAAVNRGRQLARLYPRLELVIDASRP